VARTLSTGAARFLRESISSVVQLDALVLLHDEPQRWWTPAAVAARLGTSNAAAAAALESLGRANLVDVRLGASLQYRYAPLDSRLLALVDEIAESRHGLRAPRIEAGPFT
jgi:hypothetical protein